MKIIKTIRGQLTFYFMLILAFILCIFSIVLYNIFASQSRNELDKAIVILAGSIKEEVTNEGIQPDLLDEFREAYVPFSNPKQQFIEILDNSGNSILKSQSESNNILYVEKEWIQESLKGKQFFKNTVVSIKDQEFSPSEFRILMFPMSYDSKTFVIIIGIPLSNLESTLSMFRIILLISIPIFLILSTVFGWILSKRAYAPVKELIKNAETITANNLEKRLTVNDSGDEISELTKTLNGMIARLQNSFQTLKQFTSDASHELRTPLTILKGEIEVALQKPRSAAEYESALKNSLEETDRLQKIVDGLLTLSQVESGKVSIMKEEINLKEILTEAISKINILAKKKNINIILNLDDSYTNSNQIIIGGDRNLLLNVFINLLDNSIKYSPSESDIICSEKIDMENKKIFISIKDFGMGISSKSLENIFDRFTRADLSRTRDVNAGVGLGLAIAKAVIESHDGKISLSSIPGEGSTFTVALPFISTAKPK